MRLSPSLLLTSLLLLFITPLYFSAARYMRIRRPSDWLRMSAFQGPQLPPSVSSSSSSTSLFASMKQSPLPKYSHVDYFKNRNWSLVSSFWHQCIAMDPNDLPEFVRGDVRSRDINDQQHRFGLADLHSVNWIAQNEFKSKDLRYQNRQTYAMRIGYNGEYFLGYQKQVNLKENTTTVEDTLRLVLKKSAITGAGRTDKGVHAISQVVDFIVGKKIDDRKKRTDSIERTDNDNDPDSKIDSNDDHDDVDVAQEIMTRLNSLDAAKNGHLRIYEIFRVPRKFNSRSQATWRRYLYLFPINENNGEGDVDVHFVNKCLEKVVGRELKYAALSFNADANASCKLYKAEAFMVDLAMNSSYDKIYAKESEMPPDIDWTNYSEMLSLQESINAIRRRHRGAVKCNEKDEQVDDTELNRLTTELTDKRIAIIENTNQEASTKVMCIELVGDRFLRRMVRIIAGTVIRESVLENRNEEILLDICNGVNYECNNEMNDQAREGGVHSDIDTSKMASVAIMGEGLCFCGVGFDLKELALYKMIPKREREIIMARNDLGLSIH